MPSPALRNFALGFVASNCFKDAISLPAYLVPAAIRILPIGSHRNERYRLQTGRQYASFAIPSDASNNKVDNPSRERDYLPIEAKLIASSRRRRDVSAWANLVESYLPSHLRLGSSHQSDSIEESQGPLPIYSLHLVLSRARAYAKVDILSYLGVSEGRWDAVIWLVKAMLEQRSRHASAEDTLNQLPSVLWPTVGQSLDSITDQAISPALGLPQKFPHGRLVWHGDVRDQSPNVDIGRKTLGQIWQSLGAMILQAADRSPEDPTYSAIMSHVFQILAHLHRTEAFPSSIYNYDPAADPTVLRRPPTLHFLSKRIMSILSDLEWGLEWDGVIEKYSKLGYHVDKAVLQPKIREFGPELWLDLVLWACVEGFWVTEGAWIVGEMEKRKGKAEARWSVISWEEICAVKTPEPGWLAMLKLELEKTRINHVAGFEIATGVPFTVDMGTRTISREVVLALVDGLLNITSIGESGHHSSAPILPSNLTACQNILECGHTELSANFLNAVVCRAIENANDEAPSNLRRLLGWRLRHLNFKGVSAHASLSAQDNATDHSAPVLGLLHRALHGLAREGNAQGSLGTLITIKNFVDVQRSMYIEDFANELRECLKLGEDAADTAFGQDNDIHAINPHIPVHTMLALLDVIIQHRFIGLGRWLLHNDDIDGGLMDSELYSDRNMQPVLLRFATATADDQLLTDVLQQLDAPLSEPTLHALLHCQAILGKWEAVEGLLRHLQRTPDMSWKPIDAMAIARAIMQMDHDKSHDQNVKQKYQAQELLQNILHGAYNSDRDHSQLPDLTETRTANQLGRILQTLPGSLSTITTRSHNALGRTYGSVNIDPSAVNIVLEVLVQYHGSVAGKEFWERWCLAPRIFERKRYRKDEDLQFNAKREGVVIPTLYMLRTILQPIVTKRTTTTPRAHSTTKASRAGQSDIAETAEQVNIVAARKASYETERVERVILNWGIDLYRRFGLSDREINAEIPDYCPQYERSEDPLKEQDTYQ